MPAHRGAARAGARTARTRADSRCRRSAPPPAAPTATALAATLTELDAVLREHMADEERYVLPLVEEHLTVAEWAALGERGRAGIPKDRLLIQLGWMLDGTSAGRPARVPEPRCRWLRASRGG